MPDPEQFCRSLAALTRPDGSVVLSTINRTPRAYALAILAAERVLGILPVGTHDWNKFITPGTAHLDISQLAKQPVSKPLVGQWR